MQTNEAGRFILIEVLPYGKNRGLAEENPLATGAICIPLLELCWCWRFRLLPCTAQIVGSRYASRRAPLEPRQVVHLGLGHQDILFAIDSVDRMLTHCGPPT